jgi:hypothetical protein
MGNLVQHSKLKMENGFFAGLTFPKYAFIRNCLSRKFQTSVAISILRVTESTLPPKLCNKTFGRLFIEALFFPAKNYCIQ